jgi:hypothetical protein
LTGQSGITVGSLDECHAKFGAHETVLFAMVSSQRCLRHLLCGKIQCFAELFNDAGNSTADSSDGADFYGVTLQTAHFAAVFDIP